MKELFNSNSYYEGLIQNLYGGAKGCFSAFMHFFYQYNQCNLYYKNYSSCFKTLYCVELENCEILSGVLLKMGGDNKFYSCAKKFLSGHNVDYVKNIAQIFSLDIEFLEINIIEIKNVYSKIENVFAKEALSQILQNKKKSLKMLKECYFKNNLI